MEERPILDIGGRRVRVRDRKQRSDAGRPRPTGERQFALRHRETLDIPGPWYKTPGRALTAFKTCKETCTLPVDEYEVVDDLQRVIHGKKKIKPAVEYALRLPDGSVFGWYSSINRARASYSLGLGSLEESNQTGDVHSLEVVSRGRLEVKPGLYALLCVRLGHLWASKKGRVWYKTAKAAESAWHQDGRNLMKNPHGWAMVRGREDGTWEALECYVLSYKRLT